MQCPGGCLAQLTGPPSPHNQLQSQTRTNLALHHRERSERESVCLCVSIVRVSIVGVSIDTPQYPMPPRAGANFTFKVLAAGCKVPVQATLGTLRYTCTCPESHQPTHHQLCTYCIIQVPIILGLLLLLLLLNHCCSCYYPNYCGYCQLNTAHLVFSRQFIFSLPFRVYTTLHYSLQTVLSISHQLPPEVPRIDLGTARLG